MAPNFTHQKFLAEHLAGMAAEADQQATLHRGERDQLLGDPERLVAVHLAAAEAECGHGRNLVRHFPKYRRIVPNGPYLKLGILADWML